MTAINSQEVWEYYRHLQALKSSELNIQQYAAKHGLHEKKFRYMRTRIIHTSESYPKSKYEQLSTLAREYMQGDIPLKIFCLEHNVKERDIETMMGHLKCLDIIEAMKAKEQKSMQFVQVPAVQPIPPAGYRGEEAEIIEKQNDIEIIITKGVKVSISPNIDSMKIIKIIELLKDL